MPSYSKRISRCYAKLARKSELRRELGKIFRLHYERPICVAGPDPNNCPGPDPGDALGSKSVGTHARIGTILRKGEAILSGAEAASMFTPTQFCSGDLGGPSYALRHVLSWHCMCISIDGYTSSSCIRSHWGPLQPLPSVAFHPTYNPGVYLQASKGTTKIRDIDFNAYLKSPARCLNQIASLATWNWKEPNCNASGVRIHESRDVKRNKTFDSIKHNMQGRSILPYGKAAPRKQPLPVHEPEIGNDHCVVGHVNFALREKVEVCNIL